jgi:alpha-galactosidase
MLKEITQEQISTSVNLYLSANHNVAEIFNNYFDYQNLETDKSSVSGWTSWYNYYTKINEDIIVENLNNFIDNKVPIDIFQIDDGWQEAVGDWTVNKKFPGGLQAIVYHAHQHKIKVGLWLAPFVAERKSKVFKSHPEWIRKNKDGQKVKAGYSLDWSGDFYVLEWKLPVVKEYIKSYLNVILNKWGFDLLKLDFLYAVCLGLDQKSKGQEMSEAMDWLNEVIGDKDILACGVPLASSFGKVSYCRVSSDVALKWEDGFLANHVRYRERVSTLNALRSTINRSLLNNRAFINDPDVYILRTENNQLTDTQKESLYLINQSLGGLLFTSDNIDKYTKEQWRQYLLQFPIREKSVIDLYNLGDSGWVVLKNRELIYLLTYNLSPSLQSIEIPDGDWYNTDGLTYSSINLSPFQSRIYLKSGSSDCQLIYSDGHLFPGMEIDHLNVSDNKIYIALNESCRLTTINYIFEVNNAFDHYYFNDQIIKPEIWQGRRVVKYKHTL